MNREAPSTQALIQIDAGAIMNQEHNNQAYYAGRNDAFNGIEHQTMDHQSAKLQGDFDRGYRDAKSEMKLDQDTEWD